MKEELYKHYQTSNEPCLVRIVAHYPIKVAADNPSTTHECYLNFVCCLRPWSFNLNDKYFKFYSHYLFYYSLLYCWSNSVCKAQVSCLYSCKLSYVSSFVRFTWITCIQLGVFWYEDIDNNRKRHTRFCYALNTWHLFEHLLVTCWQL